MLIIAAAALALLLGRKSGSAPEEKPAGEEVNGFEGMGMYIEPESLGKNGAAITVLNGTSLDIESGNEADFKLQCLRDGQWYCLERRVALPDSQHSYGYLQGTPMTLKLDWSEAYGELGAGHYRIVKRFYEYQGEEAKRYFFLADEFDIL